MSTERIPSTSVVYSESETKKDSSRSYSECCSACCWKRPVNNSYCQRNSPREERRASEMHDFTSKPRHRHSISHRNLIKTMILCISIISIIIPQIDAQTAYYGSYFVCNDASQCQNSDISCSDGADCHVICSGRSSCYQAHIICSDGMDCNVECSASDNACHSATIDGPITGNLSVSCTRQHNCYYVRINCPINGVCNIDATAASFTNPTDSAVINAADMITGTFTVYSARSATVNCPAGGVECNVICGQYGCLDTTFNTQNNTKLHITATGLESLKSSNIYCPYPYGECRINVESTASAALSYADIFSVNGPDGFDLLCNYSLAVDHCYTESKPPKLLCQTDHRAKCYISLDTVYGKFECADTDSNVAAICGNNISAPIHYGSYFVCNEERECQSNTILCTEGQDCHVECLAEYSCYQAHIICSDGMDCNVECTGSENRACNSATIDGPITGNLSVSCTGYHTCYLARINCPINGVCNIDATAASFTNPTDYAVINAADMISGTFTVYSARSATIKCPASGVECRVDCGTYGCLGTTFNTYNDSLLDITAHGLQALKSSVIYCPIRLGNCRINIESGSDVLTDAKIYTITEPILDVMVACDHTSDVSNCYTASNPPQIYCLNDYLVACFLIIDSGVNHWQCNDNNVLVDLCLFPTRAPTTDPTSDPTVHPTVNYTLNTTEYVLVSDIITYYNVTISLNCDVNDCDDIVDDLDMIMLKVLLALYEDAEADEADIQPAIADIQIVGDEVVLLLSVETSADQQLEPDYIKHHIEGVVEDDDRFGDIDVHIEADDDSDSDSADDSNYLDMEQYPVIVVVIGTFVATCVLFMWCNVCWCCIRKKTRKAMNQETQLVNMTSTTNAPISTRGIQRVLSTSVVTDVGAVTPPNANIDTGFMTELKQVQLQKTNMSGEEDVVSNNGDESDNESLYESMGAIEAETVDPTPH